MTQTAALQIKIAPARKRGSGKFSVGLLMVAIVLAGFFCWQHFNRLRPVRATATATTLPKTDDKPALIKSKEAAVKAVVVGFVDSVVATIKPSAKAKTVQSEIPSAPKRAVETALPAKRVTLQPAAAPVPVHAPLALTPEQKRLQVAQDGFDTALSKAVQHPDIYGFLPDDDLGNATLGREIPIYHIALQHGEKYAGQPIGSLLKPSDEWVYPIILENHVRYLVQVRYDGHNYVIGVGSRALAMNYDKILAQWPADKGFHPKLITVPGLPAYYFTIPELPEQNITDTSRMLDFNPSVSPASIVFADLP